MALLTTGLFSAGAVLGVLGLAHREQRAALKARAALLDEAADVLAASAVELGDDGFPRAEGYYKARQARLALIPDSLTFRRLPQLWLAVSIGGKWPGLSGFDVLVRPTGAEFYALGAHFSKRLEAREGWPEDVLVRGVSFQSEDLLAAIAEDVGQILADPRVKEITIFEHAVRLVFQASEGERGAHLLLRQARFEEGSIAPDLACSLLERTAALAQRIDDICREGAV